MATLEQVLKSLEDKIVATAQQKQQDILKGVKEKTRVDTGRAQAGWVSTVEVQKFGDTGHIQNDVPYIGWLEFGGAHNAGDFMVTKTLQEVTKK